MIHLHIFIQGKHEGEKRIEKKIMLLRKQLTCGVIMDWNVTYLLKL